VTIERDRPKFSRPSPRSQRITERNTTGARLIVCLKNSRSFFLRLFFPVRFVANLRKASERSNRNLPARKTLVQLLALYIDPKSLNAQRHRQTDRRTDDTMMPTADKNIFVGETNHFQFALRFMQHQRRKRASDIVGPFRFPSVHFFLFPSLFPLPLPFNPAWPPNAFWSISR